MDKDIQQALSNWLVSCLNEETGPSRGVLPETEDWHTFGNEIDQLLHSKIGDEANKIEACLVANGLHLYDDVWPLLEDQPIGLLMKAGAAKFL